MRPVDLKMGVRGRGRGIVPGLTRVALAAVVFPAVVLAAGCGNDATGGDARLVFLGGRAVVPLPDGGGAWPDTDGGRVVLFDRRGDVSAVLGGGPANAPALARPAFVATQDDGVLAVEVDGQALMFREGEPSHWIPSPLPAALVGGSGSLAAATRTVFDIATAPLGAGEPLLWILHDGEARPAGQIEVPDQALLAPVTNAGWVAPDGDRAVYWASAVRPELRRYAPDGTLEWIVTWPREGLVEPRFGVSGSTLTPVFRVVQQALVVGPDGRVYVLATTGDEGPADRLLVFDDQGTLVHETQVDPFEAVYVGRRGEVQRAPASSALDRSPVADERASFEPFDLPALSGEGRVRLADHAGRVVVVNFWASWCVPCRKEMPLLDELQATLDPERAVVIGLNEDVNTADAAAFLERIGGVGYPVAIGRGKLRARYHYRGLPYTFVLDRQGRVIKATYGFGSSIDPIAAVVRAELDRR